MNSVFDAAVLVARCQPPRHGHLLALRHALTQAQRCVVVLAGAHQARTPRNPFSWEERAALLRQCLSAAQRERVLFVPAREPFAPALWANQVQQDVQKALNLAQPSLGLLRWPADSPSRTRLLDVLAQHTGWPALSSPAATATPGHELREAFFAQAHANGPALATWAQAVPQACWPWLQHWLSTPTASKIVQEWHMLHGYHAAWAGSPYPPIFTTVDALVGCADQVLLIRRGQPPGQGLLALPGGFLDVHESLWHACLRELAEETGLQASAPQWQAALRASQVFDHPERSQRGRTLTYAHYFELPGSPPPVQAADDAADARWVPKAQLSALEEQFHDDHFHILNHFLGLTN